MEANTSSWLQKNFGIIVVVISSVLAMGKALQVMSQLQTEVEDLEKTINKMVEFLNGEDDGVRSDFINADRAIENYEQMRERALKAEMKVWYYENIDK